MKLRAARGGKKGGEREGRQEEGESICGTSAHRLILQPAYIALHTSNSGEHNCPPNIAPCWVAPPQGNRIGRGLLRDICNWSGWLLSACWNTCWASAEVCGVQHATHLQDGAPAGLYPHAPRLGKVPQWQILSTCNTTRVLGLPQGTERVGLMVPLPAAHKVIPQPWQPGSAGRRIQSIPAPLKEGQLVFCGGEDIVCPGCCSLNVAWQLYVSDFDYSRHPGVSTESCAYCLCCVENQVK